MPSCDFAGSIRQSRTINIVGKITESGKASSGASSFERRLLNACTLRSKNKAAVPVYKAALVLNRMSCILDSRYGSAEWVAVVH